MSEATVIYDHASAPRVTLTRDSSGGFTAALEVDGLDVQRSVSSEESGAGILSLDPPTVQVSARVTSKETHQALLAAAFRAVSAACTSTTGTTGGPGGLLMTYFRVTRALRQALRLIDEDI